MMKKRNSSEADSEAQQDPQGAEASQMAEPSKNKNAEVEIPKTDTFVKYDDIIENGSTYKRAMLYVNHFDSGRTFGDGTLTDDQVERLKHYLYDISEQTRKEALMYINTYNSFLQYGKLLYNARALYQKEAERLTGLLNLWEAAKAAYKAFAELATKLKELNYQIKENDPILAVANSAQSEYYTFKAENGEITLDDSRLWSEIEEQSEFVADKLSELKGWIEPLSDYIYDEGEPHLWAFLPYRIEMLMDYPDAISEQREESKHKYFRYLLRQRISNGETITPEEERIAVYPDYNEVEIDRETEEYAKQQLNNCFYLWEVEKRKKAAPKRRRKTT